jgi:hypothetical protein
MTPKIKHVFVCVLLSSFFWGVFFGFGVLNYPTGFTHQSTAMECRTGSDLIQKPVSFSTRQGGLTPKQQQKTKQNKTKHFFVLFL